jgi:hypothetical protein
MCLVRHQWAFAVEDSLALSCYVFQLPVAPSILTQCFTCCACVRSVGPVQVWSPSGKRRPPPGRWVSTGKEALKSGLNIPGVAESYDEGGNLTSARWAKGLREGEQLPPSSW